MNREFAIIPILGLLSFVGTIVGLLYFQWYERHQQQWRARLAQVRQAAIAETLAWPKPVKVVKPHRLYTPPKPASPCDCPHCRLLKIQQEITAANELSTQSSTTPIRSSRDADVTALQRGLLPAYLWPFIKQNDVIPYPLRKSRRGRKKQYSTAGFACPHLDCDYCGITDENIHALVRYGHHGTREAIPDLKCQACGRKITSRMMTALYRLRTPSDRIVLILNSIVEGMSEEGAVRTFSPPKPLQIPQQKPSQTRSNTLRRWIARAAKQSQALHAILFSRLSLPIIQLDELRAILRAPNTPIDFTKRPKAAPQTITWVWTAMCPITKIMPVVHVGPRTQDMAYTVLHELALRLNPEIAPLFLTDGLQAYYFAITAHFGTGLPMVTNESNPLAPAFFFKAHPDVLYAQVRKHRVRRKVTRIETVAMIGFLTDVRTRLQLYGFSGVTNTAFVERLNSTIRTDLAALARKAQTLARSPQHLHQLLLMWQAYYHFVRAHSSLRLPKSKQPITQLRARTPAMAANIVDAQWSFLRFLCSPTFPSLVDTVNAMHFAC